MAGAAAFGGQAPFVAAPRGRSNGVRTQALFKKSGGSGTKQLKKAAAAPIKQAKKAVGNPIKKAVPKRASDYKDPLWLPNTQRPEWLDGSLPGDRGFDPLGLAKPTEFLQIDLDQLDQNEAVNKAGQVLGAFTGTGGKTNISDNALAPYSEVFGLQRFRECELIHGRWALLATLGVLVAEASTGVSWVDAGKVELDGAQYLGFRLPFTIGQLVWIEAILVGGAEIYRNSVLDPETRLYPGGAFDPLGLASEGGSRTQRLREAEIKHGRLAMVAFLGFGVQALYTGEGALGSLAKFASTFAPELVEKIEEKTGLVGV